jgi:hypothetical protein
VADISKSGTAFSLTSLSQTPPGVIEISAMSQTPRRHWHHLWVRLQGVVDSIGLLLTPKEKKISFKTLSWFYLERTIWLNPTTELHYPRALR